MRRLAFGLAAVVVVLPGCAGGGEDSSARVERSATSPTPAATASAGRLDGCLPPGPGVRMVRVGELDGAVVGAGRTGIVLLNQSDESLCSWIPFARRLAAAGCCRALLFDTFTDDQVRAALAGARLLHAEGAARVVLLGASVGARAALAAAARRPSRVDAAVSLSGEEWTVRGPPDLAGILPQLRVPTLMVYTRNDPYVGGVEAVRRLYRLVGAEHKRLLLLPGQAHGTAMLHGALGARVTPVVRSFLRRVGRRGSPPE